MRLLMRLARGGRRAREIAASRLEGGPACGTCGFRGRPLPREVLWPELVAAWELTPQWTRWMNEREGSRCAWCGSSLRSAGLASAIVSAVNAATGTQAPHLAALFRQPRARALAIAEINSAGNLHRYLARCPGHPLRPLLPVPRLRGHLPRRKPLRADHAVPQARRRDATLKPSP